MRIYVLGKACMAVGEATLAYEYFSEGVLLLLDNEDHINDIKALLQLAFFRSTASSWRLRYREAADDLLDCREILRTLNETDVTAMLTFEVDVLADLAGFEFMFEEYDEAMGHLQEAGRLLGQVPRNELGPAHVHWIWALLHRWRGDLPQALLSAQSAATIYTVGDSLVSLGRLQTVVGDIALDLAEYFPEGDVRDSYIMLSTPYVAQALNLAISNADITGEYLALMLNARRTRARGYGSVDVSLYDRAIRHAERYGDIALLTNVYTQLGQEFGAKGDGEQAAVCFGKALSTCEKSDVSALGIWARRALWNLQST
jgi:tetratricopeptide (TPR) repeat protein